MRILLPPSEGKTAPAAGAPLALDQLSFDTLTPSRTRVIEALVQLCRTDPEEAVRVLRLGPTQTQAVARNAALPTAPTAPAGEVYCGVLFAALDIPSLPPGADPDRLLITSAAFGLLRPRDAIPAYRLSGAVRLPGLPAPKDLWGPPLGLVLEDLARGHLMVDMRSQPYAGWCPLPGVTVRVMTLRDQRRVPVSHHNKAVKGALARELVSGPEIGTAAELVSHLQATGWDAELTGPGAVEVLHTPNPA